jgi:hypothetical protein
MSVFLDMRIRVRLLPAADLAQAIADDAGAALLLEGDLPAGDARVVQRFTPAGPGAHLAGCGCCGFRSPAAHALDRLFLAKVKGEVPDFRTVLAAASELGRREIETALQDDPVAPMRYRVA